MAYKYKVYINNDREYFEYSVAEGHNWRGAQTIRTDFSFTETLLDFLYIDIYAYSENEYVATALTSEPRALDTCDAAIRQLQPGQ